MKRRTQKGIWTAVLALALCVFALVNICARVAAERYQTALDVTDEQMYALTEDTRQVVTGLQSDTNILVFSAESEYPAMLREMLRRYAQLSDRLRVTDRFMTRLMPPTCWWKAASESKPSRMRISSFIQISSRRGLTWSSS